MTVQLAVKLPDGLVSLIDRLIDEGRFRSRSEAIRAGLELVVEKARSDAIDNAFAEGFGKHPEQPDEIADVYRLALSSIESEPWEKWW